MPRLTVYYSQLGHINSSGRKYILHTYNIHITYILITDYIIFLILSHKENYVHIHHDGTCVRAYVRTCVQYLLQRYTWMTQKSHSLQRHRGQVLAPSMQQKRMQKYDVTGFSDYLCDVKIDS